MAKEITFSYEELEKFLNKAESLLKEESTCYLLNNELVLHNSFYNNTESIKGIIKENNTLKEVIKEKELIMKENERLLEQIEENYYFLTKNEEKMNYLQKKELQRIFWLIEKTQLTFVNLTKDQKIENIFIARKKINCNCILCSQSKEIFKMINDLSMIVEREIFNNSIITNGS